MIHVFLLAAIAALLNALCLYFSVKARSVSPTVRGTADAMTFAPRWQSAQLMIFHLSSCLVLLASGLGLLSTLVTYALVAFILLNYGLFALWMAYLVPLRERSANGDSLWQLLLSLALCVCVGIGLWQLS